MLIINIAKLKIINIRKQQDDSVAKSIEAKNKVLLGSPIMH